jgi:hypothetical protein
LLEASRQQVIRSRTHDDEIALVHRASKQTVAHGASDEIGPKIGGHGNRPEGHTTSVRGWMAAALPRVKRAWVGSDIDGLIVSAVPIIGLNR